MLRNGERRSETLPGAETEVDDGNSGFKTGSIASSPRGVQRQRSLRLAGVDTGHGPSTNCTLQSSPVAIVTLGERPELNRGGRELHIGLKPACADLATLLYVRRRRLLFARPPSLSPGDLRHKGRITALSRESLGGHCDIDNGDIPPASSHSPAKDFRVCHQKANTAVNNLNAKRALGCSSCRWKEARRLLSWARRR